MRFYRWCFHIRVHDSQRIYCLYSCSCLGEEIGTISLLARHTLNHQLDVYLPRVMLVSFLQATLNGHLKLVIHLMSINAAVSSSFLLHAYCVTKRLVWPPTVREQSCDSSFSAALSTTSAEPRDLAASPHTTFSSTVMDPLSIATGAASLVVMCVQVSATI